MNIDDKIHFRSETCHRLQLTISHCLWSRVGVKCQLYSSMSWSYAFSIVPWGDTKGIPALGRRRWWAEPVVRCVPIGEWVCYRLVSMPRRVSCTSELSHANVL